MDLFLISSKMVLHILIHNLKRLYRKYKILANFQRILRLSGFVSCMWWVERQSWVKESGVHWKWAVRTLAPIPCPPHLGWWREIAGEYDPVRNFCEPLVTGKKLFSNMKILTLKWPSLAEKCENLGIPSRSIWKHFYWKWHCRRFSSSLYQEQRDFDNSDSDETLTSFRKWTNHQ